MQQLLTCLVVMMKTLLFNLSIHFPLVRVSRWRIQLLWILPSFIIHSTYFSIIYLYLPFNSLLSVHLYVFPHFTSHSHLSPYISYYFLTITFHICAEDITSSLFSLIIHSKNANKSCCLREGFIARNRSNHLNRLL